MEELTAYARQKNVGIILWAIWKTLDDQLEPALDQFAKWGIKRRGNLGILPSGL
jgi:alpha-glucosidase